MKSEVMVDSLYQNQRRTPIAKAHSNSARNDSLHAFLHCPLLPFLCSVCIFVTAHAQHIVINDTGFIPYKMSDADR
jgi:hypothetical protein